jgi:hypothetical protein
MAAIRGNRIGLAVPSIVHAMIALCSMAEKLMRMSTRNMW